MIEQPYDRVRVQFIKKFTFEYTDFYGRKQDYTRSFTVSDNKAVIDNSKQVAYMRDEGWITKDAEMCKKFAVKINDDQAAKSIASLLEQLAEAVQNGQTIGGDLEAAYRHVVSGLGGEPKYSSVKARENYNKLVEKIKATLKEAKKK